MDRESQVSLESKESEAEIERWPATTGIELQDVKMRYRDDMPEVLHGGELQGGSRGESRPG